MSQKGEEMKKALIVVFMIVALACGSDAAELFDVPDAGAQPDAGSTHEYTCPENGWLETDIDHDLGNIVISLSFPDPWDAVGGRLVTQEYFSSIHVDGKVLASCHPGRSVTIEVR